MCKISLTNLKNHLNGGFFIGEATICSFASKRQRSVANVKKQLFLTESNSSVKIRADKKLVCGICVILFQRFFAFVWSFLSTNKGLFPFWIHKRKQINKKYMGILRILGIVILLAVAYNILKEFGVVEVIKQLIGLAVIAALFALAASALLSLFGIEFALCLRPAFWVFFILGALLKIRN